MVVVWGRGKRFMTDCQSWSSLWPRGEIEQQEVFPGLLIVVIGKEDRTRWNNINNMAGFKNFRCTRTTKMQGGNYCLFYPKLFIFFFSTCMNSFSIFVFVVFSYLCRMYFSDDVSWIMIHDKCDPC